MALKNIDYIKYFSLVVNFSIFINGYLDVVNWYLILILYLNSVPNKNLLKEITKKYMLPLLLGATVYILGIITLFLRSSVYILEIEPYICGARSIL